MASAKNFRFSVDSSGHCHIEFDFPGKSVNLISPDVLAELDEALAAVRADPGIRGVIFLSRKTDHFIGGAQIETRKFLADTEASLAFVEQGRAVFQKVGELSVPTLAAIHGACLGGGLELALACRFRMASPDRKTRLGLPEVMLGILPAWGGTTRLPRLIGLSAALDLLLTGRQIDARRAERLGLIDRISTSQEIAVQADRFMAEILSGGPSFAAKIRAARLKPQSGLLTKFLDRTLPGRAVVFHQARKSVLKQTQGRYPAPLAILQAVRRGIGRPLAQALPLEQEAIRVLIHDEVTRNLLHVFQLRMQSGRPAKEAPAPAPIRKVGVLGAGVMGAGIAQWLAQQNIPVRLRDINPEAVGRGLKLIGGFFEKQVSRRRMRPEERDGHLRLLSTTVGYDGFSSCGLVIEAVAEKIEIKKKVIQELQASAGDRAIFASNTSSLSVSAMAESARHPDRVLGLHFFNPVSQMPLVEVVRGKQTSDETMAAGVAFVKQIGKVPLVVADSPGFLVNRVLMAYADEACLLLEEGAGPEEVDGAMEAFGMPMGPLTMMDLVGMDIAHHTVVSIRTALHLDAAQQSRIGSRLFEAGLLGKKTGGGFYQYPNGGKRVNAAALERHLAEVRRARGITPRSGIPRGEITDRLILTMANIAAWCLENQVVAGPGDVDLGLIMGAGFPPFRGGVLKYCDKIGPATVRRKLEEFTAAHGKRYAPSALIQDLAAQGRGFYAP